MTRLRRSKPSPALVVAVLAVVAALAGTAVASDPVATTSVSKKKTKQIAKQQARKQINKLAPGLSVLNAENATNAQNATTATNADNLGGVPPSGYLTSEQRTFQASFDARVDNYSDVAPLVTLNLPPGQYAVMAKTTIENDTNAAETINCDLNGAGEANDTMSNTVGANAFAGFAMAGAFTSDAPSALTLVCLQDGADNDATVPRIVATKLD